MKDKKSALEFLAKAHRNTYAAPKEIKLKHRILDLIEGHKCYYFTDGDWEYYDMYAGSTWAPGREVILYKKIPEWAMSYQGQTTKEAKNNEDLVFEFLKRALRNCPEDMPFRGPKFFKGDVFKYTFDIKGDYDYFTGRESIQLIKTGQELFFQNVMGERIE